MAYLPRYEVVFNGSTFHVTWQCHNRDWLLKSDEIKQIYYDLLLKYKQKYDVKIHSYNFMSNHPHISGTMSLKENFSGFFRVVNNVFARKYNKIHKRRGQVVMDRFKSPVIQTDEDLLRVMIYIDLNPVRAKMVNHPRKYGWTSYHYYAHGEEDPLIDPAPSYLALGNSPKERQLNYCKMVEGVLISEGLLKKNYSTVAFIGDPKWVKEKYDKLKKRIRNSSSRDISKQTSQAPPS